MRDEVEALLSWLEERGAGPGAGAHRAELPERLHGRVVHPELRAAWSVGLPRAVVVDGVARLTFLDPREAAHLEVLEGDLDVLRDEVEDGGSPAALDAASRSLVVAVYGDEDEVLLDGTDGAVWLRLGEGPEYHRMAPSLARWLSDALAAGFARPDPEADPPPAAAPAGASIALFRPREIPGHEELLADAGQPGWGELVFAIARPGDLDQLPATDLDAGAAGAVQTLGGWFFDVLADPEQLLDLGMDLEELQALVAERGMPEPPPSVMEDGQLRFVVRAWEGLGIEELAVAASAAGLSSRRVDRGMLGGAG